MTAELQLFSKYLNQAGAMHARKRESRMSNSEFRIMKASRPYALSLPTISNFNIRHSAFDIRHFLFCINWISSYTYISTFLLACQFFLEKRDISAAQLDSKPALQFCGTIRARRLVDFRNMGNIHDGLPVDTHKAVGIQPGFQIF
jgi:hypothetical protein